MDKKQYQIYCEKAHKFFKDNNCHHLSIIEDKEAYFSHLNCDCCKRNLGGDRYDCNSFDYSTREITGPFSICIDCFYFAEYGQLDDMTMMEIEEGNEDCL